VDFKLLLSNLKHIAASRLRGIGKRGGQKPAPSQATPRDMFEVGRRAAVWLCVLLSCIAVLFASCAKAPAGESAPPDESPASTAAPVTPAL
jgi:hypothetical protein